MKILRRGSLGRIFAILTVGLVVPMVALRLLARLNASYEATGFAGMQVGLDQLTNSPNGFYWMEIVLLGWWTLSCLLWTGFAVRDLLRDDRVEQVPRVDKDRRRG